MLKDLKNIVMSGEVLSKEQLMTLIDEPLEDLCLAADEIREKFCGNTFDICTIINGKSGKCSENCKYCAQSSFYDTCVEEYTLLGTDKILKEAIYNDKKGILRYSVVTSGKNLSDVEVENLCKSIKAVKNNTSIHVCVSLGLLNKKQFLKLKNAGVERVHNNLETSRNNFENVCTTHSYEDKINSIKEAKSAGMEVCSGGIMGLGESFEDRIDMVLEQRALGIKSIPVNMLNPIKGTPYENNKRLTISEMRRIVAIFRFAIPDAFIRLAGGRGLLVDMGRSCFKSGANAAISGDMLTTSGITVDKDLEMIKELGYKVGLMNV